MRQRHGFIALLRRIARWLAELIHGHLFDPPVRATHFQYTFLIQSKELTMLPAPTEVTLSTEQRVKITAAPKSHAGNPAPVDGAISFKTDDPQLIVLIVDDVNSVWFNAPSTPGDIKVTIEADADLGDGVERITDTVIVHVVSPKAEHLNVTVGLPEDKPGAAPEAPPTEPAADSTPSEASTPPAASEPTTPPVADQTPPAGDLAPVALPGDQTLGAPPAPQGDETQPPPPEA